MMELDLNSLIKFWYTVTIVFIMSRFLYYANNGKKEYLFTCTLLAAMISLICILVSRVELSLGFAIGIFALFGIIRYRTTPISPREMTYIFLSAGIAAKNSLAPQDLEFYKLLASDVSLLLIAGLLEYFLFKEKLSSKIMVYNNLDLIHPDKHPELIQDLNKRYGISGIEKIKVGKIDNVKNSVRLLIHFKDSGDNNFNDE
jgi:hypothetical protein